MRIYFEPVVKRGKKSKKVRKTTSTTVQRTKEKDNSNRNYVHENASTKKPRSKSATPQTSSKPSSDYRPLSHGTSRYTGDRKPPLAPKTAFVKQDDAKPPRERFTTGIQRPSVQNRIIASPSSIKAEDSKSTDCSHTGKRVRYKTCFSPLLDKNPIEFCDNDSKKSGKSISKLTSKDSASRRTVSRSSFDSSSKLSSKLTVKDLVSSTAITRSDFESSGKFTSKLASKEHVSGPAVSKSNFESSETRNFGTSHVSRDSFSCHEKSETDSESSFSAKESSQSESVTLYKIPRTPSLSGVRNNRRQSQSEAKLTREEVIEQGNKRRSIGDILSSINVYLPTLQTKIDKIEKDYSRLNSFLSVAKMKIQSHVPTPNTDRPGIIAWA